MFDSSQKSNDQLSCQRLDLNDIQQCCQIRHKLGSCIEHFFNKSDFCRVLLPQEAWSKIDFMGLHRNNNGNHMHSSYFSEWENQGQR